MTTVRAWRGTVDRWLDGREPHQVQGPFTRWPRASDAALAIIAFGLSLVTVAVSGLDDGEQLTPGSVVDHPAGAIALLALAAGALWWRRARAHEVTLAIMVITIVWAALGFGDGHDVASVVAGYSLGRHVAAPPWGKFTTGNTT